MTTFTTNITAMYTVNTPDPQYVVNVLWKVTGVDGSNTASIGGNTQFNSADQEGPFIPYDQLTEQIVIGWVFDGLGTQKAEIEATLTAKVEKQINPTTANGVPWNTAPVQA